MSIRRLIFFLLSGCFIIMCLGVYCTQRSDLALKEYNSFYYFYDQRVSGYLKFIMLAVYVPKGSDSTLVYSVLDSVKGLPVSIYNSAVDPFHQEGIIFLEFGSPVITSQFFHI